MKPLWMRIFSITEAPYCFLRKQERVTVTRREEEEEEERPFTSIYVVNLPFLSPLFTNEFSF